MSDDEKQLIAEQIAKRSFDVGRNPLDTAPISKYYQKQYEKYMKPLVKDDIQDAFFEKVKSEPEKTHRYNLRGL